MQGYRYFSFFTIALLTTMFSAANPRFRATNASINASLEISKSSSNDRREVKVEKFEEWQPYIASYYFETSHPYENGTAITSYVASGCVAYLILFSQYCLSSTSDVLSAYSGSGSLLYSTYGTNWDNVVLPSTTGIQFIYSANSITGYWGIYFQIFPICDNGQYFNTNTGIYLFYLFIYCIDSPMKLVTCRVLVQFF